MKRARRNSGLSIQPPAVVAALEASEQALQAAQVRHLVCGGLAVALHGYERMTKDVDFLVGPEAFGRRGKLVFPRADVPFRHGDVAIDLVTLPDEYEELSAEELASATRVVSVEFLIFMKLLAYRPRDRQDIVELLRADGSRETAFADRFAGSRWMDANLQRRFDLAVRDSHERE